MNHHKILLASHSPRRREIMKLLHIPFTVIGLEGIDESYPDQLQPVEVSSYISNKKAEAFIKNLRDDELLITADTIVICEGKIMGKPKSNKEAMEMLRFLSGKTHMVSTGVTVATRNKKETFKSESYVTFADLTDDEIRYYVDTFHPLDKAGAYGIQEWIGAVGVAKIDGNFYNVMGLPIHRLYQVLKKF